MSRAAAVIWFAISLAGSGAGLALGHVLAQALK